MKNNSVSFTRLVCVAALLAALVGCSTVGDLLEAQDPIDYKTAGGNRTSPLQIPPDLTQISRDDRYSVPGATQSTSYTEYVAQQQGSNQSPVVAPMTPARAGMTIQRAGNQRWLVVDNRSPAEVYPKIREFWQSLGFQIRIEQKDTGIMETDWAENRAKLPQDFIRNTLGKFIDSLYSTGELDKFRTRLEDNGNGGTEVYITHYGMEERATSADSSTFAWAPRANDPELEAEFLNRLMITLGYSAERAQQALNNPTIEASKVVSGSGAEGMLMIAEPFDRAWRRVGLALDRGGFTVEDRNRVEGIYYVRYADPKAAREDKGFFARILNFSDDDPKSRPQFRIRLEQNGNQTKVIIMGDDGQGTISMRSQTAVRILDLLKEQL